MTIIALTPKLFRELDIVARTESGCCLSIHDWMDNRADFGYFSFQPEGVYKTLEITEGLGCCREVKFISLSNQIEIDRFKKGPQPEMDRRAIPKDDIYRFILFHEIGHRLFDPLPFEILTNDEIVMSLFHDCYELRADRYGWRKVFQGEPFPKRTNNNQRLEQLKEFMDSHKEWFPNKPRKVDPISTDPREMVPVSHIKKGIPWAVS